MTHALALVLLCVAGSAAESEPPRAGSDDLASARAHIAARQWDEAVRDYQAAARKAPGPCLECLMGEASGRLGKGDLGGARKAAEKAAAVAEPGSRELAAARQLEGLAILRAAGTDQPRLRQAETAFRGAVSIDPDYGAARFNLGLVLMRLFREDEGRAELRRYAEAETDEAAKRRALLIVESPRRAREIFVPDFTLRTLQGEEISSAALRGKPVLLDFWGTWCPPCVASVPEIRVLAKRYPPEKLAIVSVSVGDEEAAWRSFVEKAGTTWPQCRDADGRLAEALHVQGFPTYLLVDSEGAIVRRLSGLDDTHSLAWRLGREIDKLVE